jgi:predicted O-linked N-acetylglucosamine transferase (SPINDLY family)
MKTHNWESAMVSARDHANFGQNEPFLKICNDLVQDHSCDQAVLLRASTLYLEYGFPSHALNTLSAALKSSGGNLDCLLKLAHAQLELGHIQECQRTFEDLLKQFPNEGRVLRSLIYFAQYLPHSSNQERLTLVKAWAKLSQDKAGGPHPRPAFKAPHGQKIKIGYVSSDFCQHTVGLLIKNILAKHNTDQFEVYCYSSGNIKDLVTDHISEHSHFVEVAPLSDAELARRIRADGIDILIDLSGHTGGSRLDAFTYRAAPLQVSWLGYYASTGLECIDAFLLDRWHLHEDVATQFVEPIISLPIGRWCYSPAIDPAPLITEPPSIKNGYITFGSFNNTLKYNAEVYRVWSEILLETPRSKLILKWRTFNDPQFKQTVLDQFESHGIDATRIELRGPSFHIDMLAQYLDIDIALDPFPFSGGVTSCEALYMGVPVITWPQNRVVSRQTYAFLSSIGHSELAAQDETQYIQKAIKLAKSQTELLHYRQTLREQMLTSPLMQVSDFTQSLERTLMQLLNQIQGSGSDQTYPY